MIESIYVNKLCRGNPFRLGEEKLRRQIEVLEQDICWTYGRVYCYWKKIHGKGPGWVRWGRSGNLWYTWSNKGFWFRKGLVIFLFQKKKKNHLSASEGALLVGLFILVCSRTVTSGCYFGHRKPDGPGTRWRGRSVRTELMNHSAFPQEQLRMLKYRNPRSWRSPTASRVAVSGAMCVGQSLVLSC